MVRIDVAPTHLLINSLRGEFHELFLLHTNAQESCLPFVSLAVHEIICVIRINISYMKTKLTSSKLT